MRLASLFALLSLFASGIAFAATTDISAGDLQAMIAGPDAGARPIIVDVRSVEEFKAAHIPGAINIPHDQMEARYGEIADHSSDGRLVLYCRSGRRVGLAAAVLEAHGFSNLRHLAGDFDGWQEAGGGIAH